MQTNKNIKLLITLLLIAVTLIACTQEDIFEQDEKEVATENKLRINPRLTETSSNTNTEIDKLLISIYETEKSEDNQIINSEISNLENLAEIENFTKTFSEIKTEQQYFITTKLFVNTSQGSRLLYQGETTEAIASQTTTLSDNITELELELEKIQDDDENNENDENDENDESEEEDDDNDEEDDNDENDDSEEDYDEPIITTLQASDIVIEFSPDKNNISSGDEFSVKFADENDTSFITWTHDLADREFRSASRVEAVEAIDDMKIGVIAKDDMADILDNEDLTDEDYNQDKLIIDRNTEIADLEDKLPESITIYDSIDENDTSVDVIWDTEDFSTNQSGSQIIYGTLDLTPQDYYLDSKPKISLEVLVRGSGYNLSTEIKIDEDGTDFETTGDSMSGESGEISYVDTERIGEPPIELEASANSGWRFIEWKEENELGDDKTHTSNPAEIELADGDSKEVFARFRKLYQIDSSIESLAGGEGELEFNPNFRNYEAGEDIDIEAIAKEGSRFVEWELDDYGDNDIELDDNKLTVDSISDDINNLKAHFEVIHQIFTRPRPRRSGEIKIEIDEDNLTDDKAHHQSEVDLEAKPERGWKFVNWSSDDLDEIDGANPYTITSVEKDLSIFANFEREKYSITTKTEGEGSIELEEDTVEFESETELTATADDGWEFVDWDLDNIDDIDYIEEFSDIAGVDHSEQSTLTIESVEADYDFTANFQRKEYSITTNTEGEGSVELEEDTVEFESEAELTAIADDGWEFVEWTGDIDMIDDPEAEEITIESVESDLELTANFAETENDDD